MRLTLRTKANLCIGCSLFYLLIGDLILQDRMDPKLAPFVVFPAGLLIYFLAWKIYKYTVGKTLVILSAISLIVLILALFLL